MKAITKFRGEWMKLSNYSICSVWFEGHMYLSVEHAYQAAKFLDEKIRQEIRNCPTPNAAKKMARSKVSIRPDWDAVKIEIMATLLREKFAQKPERDVLLSTGDCLLIEGNWWGDRFWGQSPLGTGENWLGKLLMEIRGELRVTHTEEI